MARHKNYDWNLEDHLPGKPHTHDWRSIHTALLMDIRDELQTLNALLRCRNFMGIPASLRAIRANTEPRKRKKK